MRKPLNYLLCREAEEAVMAWTLHEEESGILIDNDDYWDGCEDDDDDEPCEGCGRLTGDDGEPCPLCCGLSFAPGSEDCDFCGYFDECAEFVMRA